MKLFVSFCLIGLVLGKINAVNCAATPGLTDSEKDEKSVEAISKLLEVYNQTLEAVNWNLIKDTAKALESGIGRFSPITGALVGNITTLMLNSEHNYFLASQYVFGWCGETIPLVDGYKDIAKDGINANNIESLKQLLETIIDSGVEKFNNGLAKINLTIIGFDNSTKELLKLHDQLELDYEEGAKPLQDEIRRVRRNQWIAWIFPPVGLGLTIYNEVKTIPELKRSIEDLKKFFKGLEVHVSKSIDEIKKTNIQLKQEILVIEDLQRETGIPAVTFIQSDATVQSSIVNLLNVVQGQCTAYRVTHGQVE